MYNNNVFIFLKGGLLRKRQLVALVIVSVTYLYNIIYCINMYFVIFTRVK